MAPLVFNWAEGGRTPRCRWTGSPSSGFSLVIYPIGTLLAATAGIRSLLATLKADGTPAAALAAAADASTEFTDLIGLPEVQELEQRFGAD